MLKREDEHRETRGPPPPRSRPCSTRRPAPEPSAGTPQLTRAERLAALAAEDERAPRAPQRPGTPMIVFEKTSLRSTRATTWSAAQHLAHDRQGRVGLPRRPVRLGQVDVHQAAAARAAGDRGLRPRRRPLAREAAPLEGAAAAAQHRLRVPGLQAAAEPQRVPERRLRARGAGRGSPEDRAQGARDPAARRARREARPAPARALGRRAAARLDRARVRQPPARS